MLQFRLANIDDIPKIVEIITDDILGITREALHDLSPYIKAFKEISLSADNFLYVMLLDGGIIGTFHITIIPSMPFIVAKRGNIECVHIDSAHRGMGYGTQMLQYAITIAKEKGVKICQLTTNKKRADAKRFYENLGFVATHEGMKLILQ